MSHFEQHYFVNHVKQRYPEFFKSKIVLECGSLNINGSVRSFFDDCTYIGLDVGEGQDVDVVSLAHEYNMPDNTFDTVLSCEMFEHDPHWDKSFENMIRLCKSNGLIFFTCATTGRKEHGTFFNRPEDSPLTFNIGWDHYKNLTENDFKEFFNFEKLFVEHEFSVNKTHFDLYFCGIKQ
jgi:SAM-dependent methyltransferase